MKKDMKFSKNEEAVSPVIGVILMVAITVILAAVIAAFVFGMGTPETTPQANLKIKDAKSSTNNVTIEHKGGDALKLSDVKVIVYNTTATKTTFDPLLDVTDATAFAPGSDLTINISRTGAAALILIDSTYKTSTSPAQSGYRNITANEIVTVEFWYKPNGQIIAKLQAATVS